MRFGVKGLNVVNYKIYNLLYLIYSLFVVFNKVIDIFLWYSLKLNKDKSLSRKHTRKWQIINTGLSQCQCQSPPQLLSGMSRNATTKKWMLRDIDILKICQGNKTVTSTGQDPYGIQFTDYRQPCPPKNNASSI